MVGGVAAVLAIVAVLAVSNSVAHGEFLAILPMFLTMVVILAVASGLAVAHYSPKRPINVHLESVETPTGREWGVFFAIKTFRRVALFGLLSAGAVFVGLAAVMVMRYADIASNAEHPPYIGVVLMLSIGVVFIAGGVAGLRNRGQRLGVCLTPSGVVLVRGDDERPLLWDDIVQFQGRSDDSMGRRLRRVINSCVIYVRSGSASDNGEEAYPTDGLVSAAPLIDSNAAPADMFFASSLETDPVLLYHTLRFYHSNPALRIELCQQHAIDRIRRGDVLNALSPMSTT
ncbi:hypothetical protein IEU95_15780 [Hoyosella rhizosphaerae]|uniref:Transmembrane protein n=1 Tax=Hoyosella rhizosphaerae TaxID=1755582 RepID=A0A916UHH2_9ACTN|nr:hypothetical protein [Hoyosella rhizosphaerae]MBN4928295.1 hypothetical protein [Hoyosella rhizosphaerae]GGC73887.1 hypothetical protein GCM10011410_28820 [Hoyosella rhizosphaerae]